MTRRLLPCGEHALLLECDDLAEVQRLLPLIKIAVPAITELVPGARTILLRCETMIGDVDRQRLLTMPAPASNDHDHQLHTIDVCYDGEDLSTVAERTGLDPGKVVTAHTDQTWTVAFCGFAPGFAYLRGTDERLRVPRRSVPRTRVPAGAVGLADQWSGVYPRVGPGGWQLIGRTTEPLWDLAADPPARLQPGHRVRFRAV